MFLFNSEKRDKKNLFKHLIKRYNQEIYALEMGQAVCWAEIKGTRAEEKETDQKIKEMEEVLAEKYKTMRESDKKAYELEISELVKARLSKAQPKDTEKIIEKVSKVEEILKAKGIQTKAGEMRKEFSDLEELRWKKKTYPNRIQGQEMNIKANIEAIGRKENTIKLIREQIKEL